MLHEASTLAHLLSPLIDHPPQRFAGLGLILYRPPLDLPTTPLVPDDWDVAGPPKSLSEGIRFLAGLADQSGPFHDGFHLIDVTTMTLTHICQYIAPRIPDGQPPWRLHQSVGARYMTALLASLAPCVVLAATMTTAGDISVFERGTVTQLNADQVAKEPSDQPG